MWTGRSPPIFTQRSDLTGAAQPKQALAFEPLSSIVNTNVADGLYSARQYDRAVEQYQKTDFSSRFAGAATTGPVSELATVV